MYFHFLRDLRAIDGDLKAVIKKRSSVERSFGKSLDEIEREYYETFEIQRKVKNKIKILKKNSVVNIFVSTLPRM